MDKQLQPKLRFPEFSEDLRNSNIKNEFSIFNGYAFKSEDSVKSGIRWIKIADVGINRIEENNICYLPEYFENQYKKFLLKKGDIVVALTRPILGNKLKIAKIDSNSADSLLNQRVGKLISKNNLKYIYYFLQTQKSISTISNNIAGTDPPNLSPSEINHIKFYIPSLTEQQKIADYLSTIDTKINLLEEKKAQLSLYKKAMMQKLFSQEIRFKPTECHTELVEVESVEVESVEAYPEWEEKRLGDFLVKYDQKTTMNDQYPVLTSSRKGIFFQKEYYNGQDVASSDTTGYNIVPNGYFTYRHMSDDLIFKFNINTICENGIVSTLYPVFTTKNINNNFLQIKLNEGKEFKRYAILQKQGGSRTYMYFSKLIELRLSLPSLPEQQKIANFLSAIDENIEKVNEQILQTQSFKKAMLQQMFV